MSFRMRVALFGSGVVAFTILVLSLLLYLLVVAGAPRDQDRLLARLADEAAGQVRLLDPAALTPGRTPGAINLREATQPFVLVLTADGLAVTATAEFDGAAPAVPASLLATARRQGQARGWMEPEPGVRYRVAVVAWPGADGAAAGFAVAGQAARTVEEQVRGIRRFLIFSALVSLATAGVAIWLAAGRALRPLRTLAAEAEAIGRSRDLTRRLPPVPLRDEVGAMTGSFNGMLARLEEAQGQLTAALTAQQRFVADASHELRTPLTTILANAGFLLRHEDAEPEDRQAAVRDISSEGERMSRLVHDLLTLARADAGQPFVPERFDLAALAGEVARRARTVYPGHPIRVEGDAEVAVRADRDAFTRVLWILLDNAARHTPQGTEIRVWTARRRGLALLHVADNGPGIAEADLPRLFDRFFRADRARSGGGAGLGLAIARWIVVGHGGVLRAFNNPDGGATFRVELPDGSGPAQSM